MRQHRQPHTAGVSSPTCQVPDAACYSQVPPEPLSRE